MSAIDPFPESRAERLQDLHAASLRLLNLLTVSQPEEKLLQQAIESLAELIGARYGAIGVHDDTGKLTQFVHTGIAPDMAARIGRLPEGRGLLGIVIKENHALRLDDMGKDPRSIGFPPHHPPMKSLLAVPVHHEGRVFGQVYLSDKHDGAPFTEEDERITQHFADALALTIRFHRAEAERQTTTETFQHVAQALSTSTGDAFFREIVSTLARVLRADYAFVGKTNPHDPRIIRTLAFCDHGAIVGNIEYKLAPTTACGSVGCKTVCYFPESARKLYPEDEILREFRVEAFVGHPLLDHTGRVLGLLAVMHTAPLPNHAEIQIILRLCATRATLELERLHADAERQRLSSAIAQTADSVIITDIDGTIEYVNPAFERATGYTAQEAVGHKPNLVKSGLHDDAFYQRLWDTLRQGEPFRDIFINRRKNGDLYFEEKTITPLKDDRGRITQFVSTGKNITERMQAEIALRESERRYAELIEQAPDAIVTLDLKGRLQMLNPAAERLCGYRADELTGKHFAEAGVLAPESLARTAEEFPLVAAGEERPPFELAVLRRDGGRVFTEANPRLIRHIDQPAVVQVTLRDITERTQALETLRTNETRLAEAQRMAQLGNWELDLVHNKLTWSQEIYRIFEIDPARFDASYETFLGAIHPDDRDRVSRAYTEAVRNKTPYDIEHRLFMKDGRIKFVHERGETLYDDDGKPLRSIGTIQDITERKFAEAALSESEERFRALVETTSDWIWEVDARGIYTYASPRIADLLGYTPEEIVGKSPFDLMPPDEAGRLKQMFAETAAARQPIVRLENVNLHKDGRRVVLETNGVPIFGRNGEFTGYRGIDRDITERKHAEEQLNYLAYYDTLTGLPNRALLLERLRQATFDADRVHRLVAVMFLDLDRFKYINDTLGHHVGDGLLKGVAERLRSCVRPGDTIARLGGDEFTVVLANVAHVDDVARVARKLIDSFARPFRVEGHELFTTTSIGITLYPFDERGAEGLLKNADTAMYHAKERGRNTFQYFTAELNVRAERRLKIETALRQALERNELSLHYQPQVDLKSGRLTGMEALARWKHPELGSVSPVEFIPVAEETGLILPIGEWVLREACRQIKAWHDTGFHKLQVAVNLSGKQLRQKDFPDRVRKILRETKLESRYLDLELTESLLMVDTEETATIMHALHDIGVSFSVDDFGTGYSSLAYLKRFPIDVLKIDRSFVRDIASDPNDVAIVKTVIAMAHTLGMRVIAEGVETREQLEFLRGQGCDGSQGYYCSVPLSSAEFSELLADWKRIRADRCELARRAQRASRQRRPAKAKRRKRAPRKRSAT